MTKIIQILNQNLLDSIQAKNTLLKDKKQISLFEKAVEKVISCYRAGGRIYIAGNGGSAADAQHLAAEFVSKLSKDREPLAAEALTVDTSVLTAIGNDYGYDKIFARQIQGKLTKDDIFLGITTSGNSINIIKALEVCNQMKIPSIVFSGNGGGEVIDKADYCIVPPGSRKSTIQEIHILLAHSLCECVEKDIFKF